MSEPKNETTAPTARGLLSRAITEFEQTHCTEHGQVDLSDDDDRRIYDAMVRLLFGHGDAR